LLKYIVGKSFVDKQKGEMTDKIQQMKWLLKAFDRMNWNIIQAEMDKKGLCSEINPQILFLLREKKGLEKVTQRVIAEEIGISAATVTVSVKRMEKRIFLRKIRDENDLRCNSITITKKGITLVEEMDRLLEEINQKIFYNFKIEELEVITMNYYRMIDNLESMGIKSPVYLKKDFI